MDDARFFDRLAEVPNMRAAEFADMEMKDGGNAFLFDGLAAVYDEPADLPEWVESIQQGAFRSVLAANPNVPFLHEHRPDQLLGTTRSGKVRLEEEQRGLRVKARVVKTDLSARVKALVDSGDVTGMSYGFVAGRGNQRIEMRSAKPHRIITNFKKLLDVSTTWNPSHPSTEAQFRSLTFEYADSPETLQRILMGAYPQLVDLGDDSQDGTNDDEAEARTADETVEAHPRVDGDEAALRRLQTAKRRMSFIALTTGGLDNAS